MNFLLVGGLVLGLIVVSSALGRVFGKYVDLRRDTFGKTAHKISGSMDGLKEEIASLQTSNEHLQKRIEKMEAMVTSPEWDLLQHTSSKDTEITKTVGKQQTRTS